MYDSRVALVTGGSRGIGRSIAVALAACGADVLITYRADAEGAEATVQAVGRMGRAAVALRQDVADTSSLPAFIDDVRATLSATFARQTIDYLVNNAGNGITKPFSVLTEDDFDSMMAVHVKGPVFLTKALVPHMVDGGSIVNISSGLTRVTAPAAGGYAMMKGAMEVFTRHLAAEVGSRGITVNSVAPGPTATDFGGGMLRDPNVAAGMGRLSVFDQIGDPDDVGTAVAALLTGTPHMTAQRVEVGGFAV